MYGVFNIALDSDIHFPQLPQVESCSRVVRIRRVDEVEFSRRQPRWQPYLQEIDGAEKVLWAREGNDFLLRIPELCEVAVSQNQSLITYALYAEISSEKTRRLLLDQLIPRILGQHGKLVLHASGVVTACGSGLVFSGESGWGKSTLASFFCASEGGRLMSDDCLLLEMNDQNVVGVTNYPTLRLSNDSAQAIFSRKLSDKFPGTKRRLKTRYAMGTENGDIWPIQNEINALFLLNNPRQNNMVEGVSIKKLHRTEEVFQLMTQMFALDSTDKTLVSKRFSRMTELIRSEIPVYRLAYPRSYANLPELCRKVTRLFAKG